MLDGQILGYLVTRAATEGVDEGGFDAFLTTYMCSLKERSREHPAPVDGLSINSTWVVILVIIAVNGTLGMLVAFGAIGEELGWRGFLVPELYKRYDFTKTSLISGAIWAVYHWPLLILLLGPRLGVSPWVMLPISLVAGIGLSTIMAWLRLRSGSVWVAVIFHMALNVHNQGFFQNLTTETSWLTNYVSGEHGLMLAIVSAFAGYIFWRKRDSLPDNKV